MAENLSPMAPTPLRYHLWNRGPNYLNAQQLEELLIVNRPNRPGEDVKDNVSPIITKRNGESGNGLKMR